MFSTTPGSKVTPAAAGVRLWARSSRKLGPRDPDEWVRFPNAHDPIIGEAVAAQVSAILERRDRRRAVRRQAAQPTQFAPVGLGVVP